MIARRFLTAAALTAGLTLAGGCQNNDAGMDSESPAVALGTLNEICPLSVSGKVNPDVEPSEYMGHRIGFCCPNCKAAWAEKDDSYKEAYVRSLTK